MYYFNKKEKKLIKLSKPEYKNLCKKANKGYLPVDYFRHNLFNSTVKTSVTLKRKKTIYKDDNIEIKANRSLHQKHRDLLSILMYEKNTKPEQDGSYIIQTKLYDLAKKMGYKRPFDNRHTIKTFLDDMRNTDITTIKSNIMINNMLLGKSKYNIETDIFEIEIPAETAKYVIYTTGVLIPPEVNTRIVQIPNNKSKIKALVSFLLSNKKLKNGIGFDSICSKLDITARNRKSEFRKQIVKNIKLLERFKIQYIDDKFYLEEQIVKFERAIIEKDIHKVKLKHYIKTILNLYNNKSICKYIINGKEEQLVIRDYKLCVLIDEQSIPLNNKKELLNKIFLHLYNNNWK